MSRIGSHRTLTGSKFARRTIDMQAISCYTDPDVRHGNTELTTASLKIYALISVANRLVAATEGCSTAAAIRQRCP